MNVLCVIIQKHWKLIVPAKSTQLDPFNPKILKWLIVEHENGLKIVRTSLFLLSGNQNVLSIQGVRRKFPFQFTVIL